MKFYLIDSVNSLITESQNWLGWKNLWGHGVQPVIEYHHVNQIMALRAMSRLSLKDLQGR